MSTALVWSAPLPTAFRAGDIFAFHQRDTMEIAERVTGGVIKKGMMWDNAPACLSLDFQPGRINARLDVDADLPTDRQDDFQAMVARICGLHQSVEQFESHYSHHPQLGALIAQQPGLRIPATVTPFEALTWAITGQQISVSAAVAIRRRLITTLNIRHSSGLFCHPEADQLLTLAEEDLRQAGFSASKTSALLAVSNSVMNNHLPLTQWIKTVPVDEITAQLLAIRGIGVWTLNYTLLRGFGWLDGSLHGDVAVRRGLQQLLGSDEKIGEDHTKKWLAEFAPWRSLVAAHLWATQSVRSY